MHTFESFVEYFTDMKIPFTQHKQTCYTPATPPTQGELEYMSVRLGIQKRNSFTPSIALLDRIAPHTKRKAIVNEKAAWMFICGNNILKEGIVENATQEGYVIITNEKGEVLGYGKNTGAGITNELDRGDFLRRER